MPQIKKFNRQTKCGEVFFKWVKFIPVQKSRNSLKESW